MFTKHFFSVTTLMTYLVIQGCPNQLECRDKNGNSSLWGKMCRKVPKYRYIIGDVLKHV